MERKPWAMRLLAGVTMAGLALATGLAYPSTAAPRASVSPTFENPIAINGADPYVVHQGGYYYLTMTTGGDNLRIWRQKTLTSLGTGPGRVVWSPGTTGLTDIWSPELHKLDGRWYIYYAAALNNDANLRRIYVLKSTTRSPLGPYRWEGMLHDRANQWAIDPTVLTYRGIDYLIWSGWESIHNQVQRLYIDRMISPTRLAAKASVISSPTYAWETRVAPINEGPVVLQHDGHTFLTYSADASWTNQYCLGLLTLVGSNPLNAASWVKSPKPVFQSANGIYGPGHASFTTTDHGQQWWIVYHAAAYDNAGWTRDIRIQPFTWNANGTPDFAQPLAPDAAISFPRGEAPNRLTIMPQATSEDRATFTVHASQSGTYTLWVRYANTSGSTTNQSWAVNDVYQPSLTYLPTDAGTTSFAITHVTLTKGSNTLSFLQSTPDVSARIAWIQVALP